MNEAGIKKIAGKYKVPAGTVEKDYVLSLMLLLLSNLDLSDSVVFKGGTAIKKINYALFPAATREFFGSF